MKTFFKTLALSAATLAFLAPNAANAEEVSPEPQEVPVEAALRAGDGIWQNLGTQQIKDKVYFISEDGADVKACVAGTDKVKFTIKDSVLGINSSGSRTTSGVSGDNCAKWTGLMVHGSYRLVKDNFNSVYHSVTIYD